MLTGRRFILGTATVALEEVAGKRVAFTVPQGSLIEVISGPKNEDDRMVDVRWEGRVIVMFAVDVNVRGTEIGSDGLAATSSE